MWQQGPQSDQTDHKAKQSDRKEMQNGYKPLLWLIFVSLRVHLENVTVVVFLTLSVLLYKRGGSHLQICAKGPVDPWSF